MTLVTHPAALAALEERLALLRRQRLAPPPTLTVSEWADRFRQLSREASAEPGQWRTARAPYLRGIMDAFSDPRVEEVVVMSSAQVGKTETILNVAGFYMHQDPAPMLAVLPTIDEAEQWSKTRLAPMLRDTPELAERVVDPKSRASGNTLRVKEYPGGHITLVGANAPAGLAAKPIRVVLGDEIDRWPASAGTEGDPMQLAAKRTSTFYNRKLGWFSTPTVKGTSKIEQKYQEGDQRRYYVPCPDCGHYQVLRWAQLTFAPDAPGAAVYACEGCGAAWDEADKLALLEAGEWRAHAPPGTVASFHLNALYSPWARWGELASEWMRAQGDVTRLQVFVNTVLGETWEDRGSFSTAEWLAGRREVYDAPCPAAVQVVTAGADVQPDRIEAVARGWGVGEEAWLLERAIFLGDSTLPETVPGSPWAQLEAWRAKGFARADGTVQPVAALAVDSGYNPEAVYAYVKSRWRQRVYATRGYSTPGKPLVTRRPSMNNKARCRVFYVGTDAGKDSVYGRLKVALPGPLYWHFPLGADRDYFEQLTSERRERKMVAGRWVSRYECPPGRRNEVLDCEVLALVALQLVGIPLGEAPTVPAVVPVAASEPVPPTATPAPPDERPTGRVVRTLRRRGFVQSW